jgi:hypothetical protein
MPVAPYVLTDRGENLKAAISLLKSAVDDFGHEWDEGTDAGHFYRDSGSSAAAMALLSWVHSLPEGVVDAAIADAWDAWVGLDVAHDSRRQA